jgi:hypothetical protein
MHKKGEGSSLALCENNFARFVVKRERNHKEHKDLHEVRKGNLRQTRLIRVFRVRFKKGTLIT